MGNLALARVEGRVFRGRLFLVLGFLSGLSPMALSFAMNIPTAIIGAAVAGATTAGFMTLSHGIVQAITDDRVRGRVMSANTWHVQGAMGGFNAINGVLMDLSWMSAPLLLSGAGLIFMWVMISSVLTAPLRAIYSRGIPAEAYAH